MTISILTEGAPGELMIEASLQAPTHGQQGVHRHLAEATREAVQRPVPTVP
jgi:hypothetical protein